MNIEKLIDSVIQWGRDRNIIGGASALDQQKKLEEEVAELRTALEANDGKETIDAIGDATVVLIMQASILGVRFEDCLAEAYEVIKHRKGKLVDGVYYKEEDFAKHGIS